MGTTYIISVAACYFSVAFSQCIIEPNIVNDMEISSTLSGWTLCYDQPYSHVTTSSNLGSCAPSANYWVFVGAKQTAESNTAYVGAFAPASRLTSTTASTSTAYRPTTIHGYDIYWYNYPTRSFGFAPTSSVNLGTADVSNTDDNTRLSWHLDNGANGGWRAGTVTNLNNDVTWRKIMYYIYCPNPQTAHPTAFPTLNPTLSPTFPTTAPTFSPTSSPTFNASNCEDLGYIKHINWNNMVSDGQDEVPDLDYTIAVSSADMTLTINVELDYLGYSYINNVYGFGTRYHLGFYSFDSDSIISNCDNRLASSFVNKTWAQQWEYSEYPYLPYNQIGSENYLAYPPSDYWTLSMDPIESCSKIIYSAVFTWQDLRGCKSDDGVSSAVAVDIDGEFINMSGKFFVDVVSPVSMDADILYRSYELLSHPFVISIQKSSFAANSVDNIFTFTSSILDVGKNNEQENVLEIVLLTESIDLISLSNPILLASPDYDESRFTIANNMSACLSINSDLCAQLWYITVDVECPFTFNGDFAFQFTANCKDNNEKCTNYTDIYGSSVSLSAGLTFEDYICSDDLFTIEYNSTMVIYGDDTFTAPMPGNAMALIGDRIYVEISVDNFNVDDSDYAVLNAKLLNVWLCTSEDELSLDQTDFASSGCFASNIDPDGPYHIIVNHNESVANGTRYEDEESNKIIRFSFIIPNTITRDTLFIQTQISLQFSEDPSGRRLLETSDSQQRDATQMVFRSGSVLLTEDNEVVSEVDPIANNKHHEKENTNDYVYIIIAISIVFVVILGLMAMFIVYKSRGKPDYDDVKQIEPQIDNNLQLTANNEEQAIAVTHDM